MITLIVSYYLVVYLLIPAAIFRVSSFFVPLKKFERTRSEEITFAVLVCALPLIVTIILSRIACLHFYLGNSITWEDYKNVVAASYSEKVFNEQQAAVWKSAQSVAASQIRFVVCYYLVCLLQAGIFAISVANYGRLRGSRLYQALANLLLRNVSEWHILLSTFNFPSAVERKVSADVLTAEDHLYQGDVSQYFLDKDGALSGLFLSAPKRFDRRGYLSAQGKDPSTKPESFWKDIPGFVLYIPRDKILSLNLRYPLRDARAIAFEATRELRAEGLDISVELSVKPPTEPVA